MIPDDTVFSFTASNLIGSFGLNSTSPQPMMRSI